MTSPAAPHIALPAHSHWSPDSLQMFKLIMPHFRYTMAINAAARALLINKDGVIESSFSTGPYSMEASARAYAADWRFDEQGLPADLKKRWGENANQLVTAGWQVSASSELVHVPCLGVAYSGLGIAPCHRDAVNAAYLKHSYCTGSPRTTIIALLSFSNKVQSCKHFCCSCVCPSRGLMTAEGKLLVDDYPYAQDGLLIWSALETYFSDYLSLYYNSDADVASDTELQVGWT